MNIRYLSYFTFYLLSFFLLNKVLPSYSYSVTNTSQLINNNQQEINQSNFFDVANKLSNDHISQQSENIENLNKLGREYQSQGKYEQAIKAYQQLLKIAQKNADKFQEASAYGNLGNNYRLLGNYNQALTNYQKSLPIWQELDDQKAVANVYRGMGNVHLNLGNYDKAIELHQKSLTITKRIKDKLGEAESYLSIGAIYSHQEKYAQALQNYQKKFTTSQRIKTN